MRTIENQKHEIRSFNPSETVCHHNILKHYFAFTL